MLMLMATLLAKTPSQGHRSRTSLQSRTRGPNRHEASLDRPSYIAEVHSRTTFDLWDDATFSEHLSENRDPLGADGPQVQVATADKMGHPPRAHLLRCVVEFFGSWHMGWTPDDFWPSRSPKLLAFAGSERQQVQGHGDHHEWKVVSSSLLASGPRPPPSLGKLRKAAPTSSGRCVQTSSRVVSERQGACPASTNLVHCQYSVVLRPNCEETVKILPMTGSSVSDELTYSGTWAQGSCLF